MGKVTKKVAKVVSAPAKFVVKNVIAPIAKEVLDPLMPDAPKQPEISIDAGSPAQQQPEPEVAGFYNPALSIKKKKSAGTGLSGVGGTGSVSTTGVGYAK